MDQDDHYQLFTDGACSGNPGPGGWAFILRRLSNGQESRRSGAELDTTNNRMELASVVHGLEAAPPGSHVYLVTDSEYVGKGIREWMAGWKSRGWMRKEGKRLKPVKNAELWQAIDQLMGTRHVEVEIVRGHSGHEENEECDRMAVAAYQKLMGA